MQEKDIIKMQQFLNVNTPFDHRTPYSFFGGEIPINCYGSLEISKKILKIKKS